MRRFTVKEKDPEYTTTGRRNTKIATRCRVCGGKLYSAQEIKKEIHDECDVDNTNMYMM
tara:strand:- start:481 stop:657 length:177 start_codon:yes stop_codon:yes gene_type:complete